MLQMQRALRSGASEVKYKLGVGTVEAHKEIICLNGGHGSKE